MLFVHVVQAWSAQNLHFMRQQGIDLSKSVATRIFRAQQQLAAEKVLVRGILLFQRITNCSSFTMNTISCPISDKKTNGRRLPNFLFFIWKVVYGWLNQRYGAECDWNARRWLQMCSEVLYFARLKQVGSWANVQTAKWNESVTVGSLVHQNRCQNFRVLVVCAVQ